MTKKIRRTEINIETRKFTIYPFARQIEWGLLPTLPKIGNGVFV